MRNMKIPLTVSSVICAAILVISAAVPVPGSNPGIETAALRTAASGNVAPASVRRVFTGEADNGMPDSKVVKILSNTGTPAIPNKAQTGDSSLTLNNAYTDFLKNAFRAESKYTTGNPLDSIKAFFESASKGINNLEAHVKPVTDTIDEIYFYYDNNQGEHLTFQSGLYYDKTTMRLYGKDGTGLFAFGYDADLDETMLYAPVNSWHRNLGFCELYDVLCPLLNFDVVTTRIKFRYNNLDWMIQFWKGRYMFGMGGEMGIYNKPLDRAVEFYDCAADEQMMPMSMEIWQGDVRLFEQPLQTTWWQTGFVLRQFCQPGQLTMDGSIVFPDEGMRAAFTAAMDKQADAIHYTVEGNTVSFVW